MLIPAKKWIQAGLDWALNKAKPDVVIMVSTLTQPGTPDQVLPGHSEVVSEFLRKGIKVIGMRDTSTGNADKQSHTVMMRLVSKIIHDKAHSCASRNLCRRIFLSRLGKTLPVFPGYYLLAP